MTEQNPHPQKTIIGRIGETVINETIHFYQAYQPEEELTAQKNICKKFENLGLNPQDVIFEPSKTAIDL